jgi:hypothetical protein
MSKTSLKRHCDEDENAADLRTSSFTCKRTRDAAPPQNVSSITFTVAPPTIFGDRLFTQTQVDIMMNAALKQQRKELEDHYNILLNEQFNTFTLYNQDYLYRDDKRSTECSYVN